MNNLWRNSLSFLRKINWSIEKEKLCYKMLACTDINNCECNKNQIAIKKNNYSNRLPFVHCILYCLGVKPYSCLNIL